MTNPNSGSGHPSQKHAVMAGFGPRSSNRSLTMPGSAGTVRVQAHRNRRIRCVPDSSGVQYRVSYSANTTTGQWRAHGRYVARASATIEHEQNTAGSNGEEKGIDMAGRLGEWQAAGDDRLWKLIFSPEFGDRIDASSG